MIWTEAFRPQNLDEVVGQERVVKFFRNIGNTDVSKWPHFIFHGPPGIGKTTMAWAIANHYNLDIIEINASHYRKVEDMETTIMSIVKQLPEKGKRKIILMDEADGLGTHSQWMLRRYMEEYSNVSLFIFSCNYPNKIIPAIFDRCIDFRFDGLTSAELKNIAVNICKSENREVPPDKAMEEFVSKSDGSARSFTNLLFQYLIGGIMPEVSFDATGYLKAVKLNDLETAKKMVVSVSYSELLKECIRILLMYGEKYQEAIRKHGDYLILSQNPDESLGKIVATLQLNKYLNGGS